MSGRAKPMTDQEAAEVFRRFIAGETMRKLVNSAGAPFSREKLRRYRASNPAYNTALNAAIAKNTLCAIRLKNQRRSVARTHCKHGHLLAGENCGWKIARGSTRLGRFCRQCARDDASKIRPMTPEKVERVKLLVSQGVALHKIYKGGSSLYVTQHQNIEFQRVIDPAFDRLIENHLASRTERGLAAFYRRILPPTTVGFDNSEWFSRFTDYEYRRILASVPRDVPSERREDVAHDVIAALREGRVGPDHIGLFMRRFVTANNIASGANRRVLSLDETHSNRPSLNNIISQGLWQ